MKSIILAVLFAPMLSHADWQLTAGATAIENVNIASEAKVTTEAKSVYPIEAAGAGLRTKRVIFDVKVYVAQLLVTDPAKFDKSADGALKSLNNESAAGIRLTFLRDVDAATVMTSFQDAFEANNIDQSNADIASFLADVNKIGNARTGASITIFIVKQADGKETLRVENTATNVGFEKVYGAGTMGKVFSIWLGVPADSGLAKLKDQLLGKN